MTTSLVLEMALILWILSEDCCVAKSLFWRLGFLTVKCLSVLHPREEFG